MVEIYQNQELNDICFEVKELEEWKKLAKELNMDSQLSFADSKSPNPYPYTNKSMEIIFETLCPMKIDYKKYDKTPIPLEVMKQIAYSKGESHFKDMEIWFDDKSPDPCVIGLNYNIYCFDKSYNRLKDSEKQDVLFNSPEEAKEYCKTVDFELYGTAKTEIKKYLIARWADVVRPINELKELAKERLVETFGATLKNEIEEKSQALKKLNENVILYLSGELSQNQLKGAKW